MLKYSVINSPSNIPLDQKWHDSPKFKSKGLVVIAQGGQAYQIISKKERGLTCAERAGRRFLGVLAVICSLGLALIARSVKDLFVKKTMHKRFAIAVQYSQGSLTLQNGNIYYGYILNDKPHGQGTLTFKNGGVYVGDFLNGQCNGKGKLTFAHGVYEGEFANDLLSGKGKIAYTLGSLYEGEFAFGNVCGKGRWTDATGKVREGNFFGGKLLSYN